MLLLELMKYEDLIQYVKKVPYFDETFLNQDRSQVFRNQLSRWVKQAKLVRLKRGLYTLPPEHQQTKLSNLLASNILYSPSYISLEFALSYYDLIPEKATVLTAVSTHKKTQFQNGIGTFTYRKIKRTSFFGYLKIKDYYGFSILMATPEKALIDKLYFDTSLRFEKDYFLENLRLQNFENLNIRQLRHYAQNMGSLKLKKMLKILILLIRKERS